MRARWARWYSSENTAPAGFPLLGLLSSLGCWVRARQKPSKDPAKTQHLGKWQGGLARRAHSMLGGLWGSRDKLQRHQQAIAGRVARKTTRSSPGAKKPQGESTEAPFTHQQVIHTATAPKFIIAHKPGRISARIVYGAALEMK